jgi:hemoglobin
MKKLVFTTLLPAAVLACSLLTVALPANAQSAAAAPSMPTLADDATYRAFGQKPGLVKLVDDFMERLLADPRTGPFFKPANQKRVKEQLVEQFCHVLGGPCVYKGADMASSHANLDINKAHFNALVEVLQLSMDAQGVAFTTQNKLLAQLAPMYRDIITVR